MNVTREDLSTRNSKHYFLPICKLYPGKVAFFLSSYHLFFITCIGDVICVVKCFYPDRLRVRLLIIRLKSVTLSAAPCGTPHVRGQGSGYWLPTITLACQFESKDWIHKKLDPYSKFF